MLFLYFTTINLASCAKDGFLNFIQAGEALLAVKMPVVVVHVEKLLRPCFYAAEAIASYFQRDLYGITTLAEVKVAFPG